jgi:hypothetical protein
MKQLQKKELKFFYNKSKQKVFDPRLKIFECKVKSFGSNSKSFGSNSRSLAIKRGIGFKEKY